MKITVESLRKIEKEGSRFLGVVNVILNDALVIENIRIIQGPEKKFIAMPSKKVNDTYIDFAHPINDETKNELVNAVISTYEDKGHVFGMLDEMIITKVRINYTSNATGLLAIADVQINNKYAIHDIMIVKELLEDGRSAYKFLLPSREDGEGVRRNIFYSINKEFTDKLFQTIFEKYKEGLK